MGYSPQPKLKTHQDRQLFGFPEPPGLEKSTQGLLSTAAPLSSDTGNNIIKAGATGKAEGATAEGAPHDGTHQESCQQT